MKRYLHLLLTLMLLSVCTVGGAQTTVKMTSFSATSGNVGDDTNVSYKAEKGNASTAPGVYNKQVRVYQNGGLFTVSVKDGYKLDNVTIGSSSATSVTYVTDVTTTASDSKSITAGKTISVDLTNGEKSITFTCTGTTKSSRLNVNSLSVTYSSLSNKKLSELSFSEKSDTAKVGESFEAPNLTNPHKLSVTYASTNKDVATVDASTGKVTPVAVGITKIIASSIENDEYIAGSASYTLIVKGNYKGAIFVETFDGNKGSGGYDENWSGAIASDYLNSDNENWKFVKEYGANLCARFGTSGEQGSATTPSITIPNNTNAVLTFRAGAWTNDSKILKLSATNATLDKSSVTLVDSKFSDYTINITDVTGPITIKFEGNSDSKSRFFLDEVVVTPVETETYTPATLSLVAKSGDDYYATFSSDKVTFFPESNDDMTFTTDVQTANAVGDMMELKTIATANATIDGKEVSGYFVPANTGVLIKASFDGASSIPYYTVSGKEVDALSDNMLYPATKAMSELTGCYFYKLAYDDYTAKKGLGFYWGAAGGAAFTAKSNGAYLAVEKTASAKSAFRFDGTTTAISAINTENAKTGNAVYNIQGQRVGANYKGLVIVNGKKMMRK